MYVRGLVSFIIFGLSYGSLYGDQSEVKPQTPQRPLSSDAFQLRAIHNHFLIEKRCPPQLEGVAEHKSRFGNTLEFGINVWTPQALPADHQYFMRYTCDRSFPAQ